MTKKQKIVEEIVDYVQGLIPSPHHKLNEVGKEVLRDKIQKAQAQRDQALMKEIEGMRINDKGAEKMALERGWIDDEPRAFNLALQKIANLIKE